MPSHPYLNTQPALQCQTAQASNTGAESMAVDDEQVTCLKPRAPTQEAELVTPNALDSS